MNRIKSKIHNLLGPYIVQAILLFFTSIYFMSLIPKFGNLLYKVLMLISGLLFSICAGALARKSYKMRGLDHGSKS